MISSIETKDICAAVAALQGELKPAPFDRKNPHLGSKYASLASCRDSSKELLAKNGLSVVQFALSNAAENLVGLTTRLCHKSGQFFEDTAWCRPKTLSPQDFGSAITYLKRYCFSAAIGQTSDDDDDGNQAQGLNASNEANDRLKSSKPASAPLAPDKQEGGYWKTTKKMQNTPIGTELHPDMPDFERESLAKDLTYWRKRGGTTGELEEQLTRIEQFLSDEPF